MATRIDKKKPVHLNWLFYTGWSLLFVDQMRSVTFTIQHDN
ncbi:hypothetical protein [Citrobacter pasteurii]|nr:hypothetical protein SF123566_4681 [Shigella flexneri 1235-66]CEJ65650.1 hypothetical protein [Citrobacter pasteurii]